MRVAFFHEDDYCQIELTCSENIEWCISEAEAIEDFSNRHRAGAGWDAMYIRKPNPVELVARGITIESLTAAMTPHLPSFDVVETGYSTQRETLSNTLAFGESNVVLFAEHDQRIVSAIWFTLQPSDDEELESVVAISRELSQWNLLFVDWGWRRVIPLNDEVVSRNYLHQRIHVFSDLYKQFEQNRQASIADTRGDESWLSRLRRWIRS